jgi:SET domain-containing protein
MPKKKKFEQSELIFLADVRHKGRGVFAKLPILAGQIIEVVPVLFMKSSEFADIKKSSIANDYVYEWDEDLYAVALGYGSLYNHSYEPNAQYLHGEDTIMYRALRNIEPGEEVTINYNFDPEDKTPMHFEVR